jgi:hypothetical protein
MGFSGITDHVTVYADSSSSVANGKTTTQDVSGGTSTNSFGRFGTYIAVTPVFGDANATDVEEVAAMNKDVALQNYKNNVILSGNGVNYTVSGVKTNAAAYSSEASASINMSEKALWLCYMMWQNEIQSFLCASGKKYIYSFYTFLSYPAGFVSKI